MKVGFSFGRCVRDLVNGTVDYGDVLLIYASTRMVEREHILQVISQYMWRNDYLGGLDQDKCNEVAFRLWDDGKIVQPRVNGRGVQHIKEAGVWMDLAPTVTVENENALVQKAWRDYQMALKLSNPEALPDDQFRKRTPEEEAALDEAYKLLAGSI